MALVRLALVPLVLDFVLVRVRVVWCGVLCTKVGLALSSTTVG